jgi:hypothetical protein
MPASVSISRFPTRQYPYRARGGREALDTTSDPLKEVSAGAVVRFFLGWDEAPVVLPSETLSQHINDPFARLVLNAGHRPQTLLAVLTRLNGATGDDAVPAQRLYRVADGGQIAWTPETAGLDRHLRIVITRHSGEEARIFISTTSPFDSETAFLQIFAWDPVSGAYNFYERRRGIWSWAGSSWQALEEPTRGMGPFDSHVNGGPVMKELKAPWMHWHSQSSQIRDDILAPGDGLRTDSLYNSADLKGGEDLELIVRAGTARWTQSRFERLAIAGRLENAPDFLRHILTTTTINIACSPQQSGSLADDEVLRLPTTFFLASDCLIDELKLPATIVRLKTPTSFYIAALERYAVRLKDGLTVLERDTHFAFAVPEPSFEDQLILRALLERRAVSRKQAICLLMVDFPNPIYSERRAALLRYVPATITMDGGAEFDRLFIGAVRSSPAAATTGTPEFELLELWDQPDGQWEMEFSRRIEAYWTAIQSRIANEEGFDEIFRLAESRRRQFRKQPLAEFGLTLSYATKLQFPTFLKMTEQAHVEPT